MVNLVLSAGQLALALVLVLLNGFFVASEFALVRIRSTTVEQLADAGRPGSAALQGAVSNLDDYLATTQLGITIASLGLGWVGEPAVAALLEPVLESVLPESALHLVAFALGFSIITFLHVVFGELAPKTIAIQRAERLALLIAPPMKVFYYLFIPGIIVFNGTANAFVSLLGIEPASESEESLGEEELLLILSRSGEQGLVDREEVRMIRRIFELDDITARTVMIPRPDVVWVSPDASLADLRALVEETGHTRYPVVGDEGTVQGFVDVKDVVTADDESVTAADLAREMPVVPETTRIDDLLRRFRDEHVQMAAVIDEFGALEGIVTVEDVLEEVVGDLRDRFDEPDSEHSLTRHDDGTATIDGGVRTSTVAARLGLDLPETGTETVGGLVLERLGRPPETGDSVEVDSYLLEVTAVDGMRVGTVHARPLDESVADRTGGDDGGDGERESGEQ
jgi:CBS domain containing-hemolysin-like protein